MSKIEPHDPNCATCTGKPRVGEKPATDLEAIERKAEAAVPAMLEELANLRTSDPTVVVGGKSLSAAAIERFHTSYRKGNPDECWPWQRTSSRGRPVFWSGKESFVARRVAWVLAGNPEGPTRRHVEVRCGLTTCVNPGHLYQPTYAERFWAMVDKRGPGECWPWKGATSRHRGGYGHANKDPERGRGTVRASRVAYELHHGIEAPAAMFVCHACDNPICCNPAHLWLGTSKDNTQDMLRKGRAPHQRRAS